MSITVKKIHHQKHHHKQNPRLAFHRESSQDESTKNIKSFALLVSINSSLNLSNAPTDGVVKDCPRNITGLSKKGPKMRRIFVSYVNKDGIDEFVPAHMVDWKGVIDLLCYRGGACRNSHIIRNVDWMLLIALLRLQVSLHIWKSR